MLAETREGKREISDRRAKLIGRYMKHRSLDLLVLVQGVKAGELYGGIACSHLPEPVPFGNIRELILQIDRLGRQMTTLSREGRFHNQEEDLIQKDSEERAKTYTFKPRDFFHLNLIGMEHDSLQGWIRGQVTKGKHVCFRSALELMAMLSSIETAEGDFKAKDEGL